MEYSDIYKSYHKKVLKYLAGIVGQSEAEDLVQEVFIKVGKKLDKLKDESKLSSWIFAIALNTAKDKLRHRSSKKSGQTNTSKFPETATAANMANYIRDTKTRTPEENLVFKRMIECFIEFVEKMPKSYHDVYVFSEFDALSDKEISKKLSLPIETVKMRLHRARAQLYGQLRSHCYCYCNERGELMGDRKPMRPPKPSGA
jgi:RNA polymerase sigma-70 factor, ECF subfamily